MRLAIGLCPALTEDVLAKLQAAGVTNIITFMQKDVETLALETSVSYKDLQSIRRIIHAHFAAFPLTGAEMLSEAVQSTVIISTGVKGLDTLLGGGLMTGEIVEICGGWGIGKTTLCVQLALHAALKLGLHAYYVDPTASVSTNRLAPLLDSASEEVENVEQALSRIQIVTPSDVWGLFQTLKIIHQPQVSLSGQSSSNTKIGEKISLMIVDSLPSLLSPLLYGSQTQGWGIVSQVASTLKQIASEHQMAIVVVNSVVSANFGSAGNQGQNPYLRWKPALGRFWAHVPNTRLYMERIKDPVQADKRPLDPSKSCGTCGESSALDVNVTVWKSTRLKLATLQVSLASK